MIKNVRETDLLLRVWREACRHIELEQSIEEIARLISADVAADYLIVRQLDLIHGGLDTVAQAPCRPNAPGVAATRSNLSDAAMQDVLVWHRDSASASGPVPGDPILGMISPAEFRGDCVAAPLNGEAGPLGVVLLGLAALAIQTRGSGSPVAPS